jgi:multidrug efflux pump subunit AcrA (membrane-fusion protein)
MMPFMSSPKRPFTIWVISAVLAGLPVASSWAQSGHVLDALQPQNVDTQTARDSGFLDIVDAKVGDTVVAGQLLMKLDHERQLHAYNVAKIRSENQSGIEIAEGELREKYAILEDVKERHRKRQASDGQLEQAQAQAQVAKGKLSQAKMGLELAKLEFELAEKLLENRYIRSPINGTIMDISKRRGDKVNQGDLIVTVADMTTVAGEIPVTMESAQSLAVGSTFPVRLAGSQIVRNARVESISPLPHAKSGEKVVKVVFENMRPQDALLNLKIEALLPEHLKTVERPKPPEENKDKAKKS